MIQKEKNFLIDSLYVLHKEKDLFMLEKINNLTYKMKSQLRQELSEEHKNNNI